ncbi:MAG: hypothetical protein CM15mP126_2480 [Gammaproteobacteria bacterium]|nr:MAG: hypothetical protein CM15mP126_2480 [Gammaproteobacteria bacterium]
MEKTNEHSGWSSCDLRLTINNNGRVIKANLIRSSGNIRFDNSALKAVQRVETFNFLIRFLYLFIHQILKIL